MFPDMAARTLRTARGDIVQELLRVVPNDEDRAAVDTLSILLTVNMGWYFEEDGLVL